MNPAPRNGGALRRAAWRKRLCSGLVLALMAPAMHAQELRLLHAEAAAVSSALQLPRDTRATRELELRIQGVGRTHTLHLEPNASLADVAARTGGRAEAYSGRVEGYPDSWAALTRIGSRWSGIWYDGGDYFGIEAGADLAGLRQRAGDDAAGVGQLVYRLRDLQWDAGLDDDFREAPPGNGQRLAAKLAGPAPMMAMTTKQPHRRLAVAFVSDAGVTQVDGADADAKLLARLNVINVIYGTQLGVEVTAAGITQFTRTSDPLRDTDDADDLLASLADWRTRHVSQRGTALTHLFTGRDLEGRTIGLAYLDTLCHRRYSASLSEVRGPPGFVALVAAHEIAHVFGAPHDGDAARACAATPEQYLMASRINGSQQFSACSRAQMAQAIETAACLVKIETTAPDPELPAQPVSGSSGGGGGVPDALALWLLGLMWAVRRANVQMRANQSSR